MKEFAQLGLKKDIIQALNSVGHKNPLEIQEKVIPLILQKKNVLFQSQTGSGKTLAFTLGFLSRLNLKLGLQMVIITPTRELCQQVGKEIQGICDMLSINVGIIFGGRDIKGDHRTYKKKNQIMVVTPGRFVQHVNDKNIRIGEVKFLIFDECDQMFDDQFLKDCIYIRKRTSTTAQIVLASATITFNVTEFLKDIDHEEVLLDKVAENIVQEKISCRRDKKLAKLVEIVGKRRFRKYIVFANTKVKLFDITEALQENHFKAASISADLNQNERNNILDKFKHNQINVLVATDVAARGLHIENVDTVINFDVPPRKEFYVHRIGRTGRVGKKGHAVTLVCREDEERMQVIEDVFDVDVRDVS